MWKFTNRPTTGQSIIGTKAIANENIFLIYIIRHHLASSEEENSMQKSFEACIKLVWMEVSGNQENFLRQSNGVGESYSCKGNPRRQQVWNESNVPQNNRFVWFPWITICREKMAYKKYRNSCQFQSKKYSTYINMYINVTKYWKISSQSQVNNFLQYWEYLWKVCNTISVCNVSFPGPVIVKKNNSLRGHIAHLSHIG